MRHIAVLKSRAAGPTAAATIFYNFTFEKATTKEQKYKLLRFLIPSAAIAFVTVIG